MSNLFLHLRSFLISLLDSAFFFFKYKNRRFYFFPGETLLGSIFSPSGCIFSEKKNFPRHIQIKDYRHHSVVCAGYSVCLCIISSDVDIIAIPALLLLAVDTVLRVYFFAKTDGTLSFPSHDRCHFSSSSTDVDAISGFEFFFWNNKKMVDDMMMTHCNLLFGTMAHPHRIGRRTDTNGKN